MSPRIDVMNELRAADPVPERAEIDRIADSVTRRIGHLDPTSPGNSGVQDEPDERWPGNVIDLDKTRRPRRVPVLAAAVVATVVIVAVVVLVRSTDNSSIDVATPPPATTADHTGRSPFPIKSGGYRVTPTIDNSLAMAHPNVVVVTVTDLGPVAEQKDTPDLAGDFPNGILYWYQPVTVRVDDALTGTAAAGDQLNTRVILNAETQPIQAMPGDRLLLFLDDPGPVGSPVEGIYPLAAGFFVDGDTVIDPYGTNTPLSTVRAALTSTPSPAGSTGIESPTATSTTLASGELRARLELRSSSLVAGSKMDGNVIIEIDTGQPINALSCGSPFQVVLSNADATQSAIWTMCAQTFVIATGESSWPVTVVANYGSCASSPVPGDTSIHTCLPGGSPPPLPPGRYTAKLESRGINVTASTQIDITSPP